MESLQTAYGNLATKGIPVDTLSGVSDVNGPVASELIIASPKIEDGMAEQEKAMENAHYSFALLAVPIGYQQLVDSTFRNTPQSSREKGVGSAALTKSAGK